MAHGSMPLPQLWCVLWLNHALVRPPGPCYDPWCFYGLNPVTPGLLLYLASSERSRIWLLFVQELARDCLLLLVPGSYIQQGDEFNDLRLLYKRRTHPNLVQSSSSRRGGTIFLSLPGPMQLYGPGTSWLILRSATHHLVVLCGHGNYPVVKCG